MYNLIYPVGQKFVFSEHPPVPDGIIAEWISSGEFVDSQGQTVYSVDGNPLEQWERYE